MNRSQTIVDSPCAPVTRAGDTPTTQESEADFVRRLKLGDASAFDQLVRSAGPRLLAVARRMLVAEDDAHDAVQEAFLNAFKALDRFDARSQLTTWLHRIVVNACLMKMRSRRRRPERAIGDLLPEFLEDGHQKHPAAPWRADARLERDELRTLIRAKIDELPQQYQEILLLRDIEELDTDATATLLGLTPAAVKTRLHRARQALKALLDPHFSDNS